MPRALISVHDKSRLEILLICLSRFGYEIVASGGTAQRIRELGYRCIEISAFTGYPESPRGLVKTLHPKVHGGFLLDPSNPEDRQYMLMQGIVPIDLLVVNLYPFVAAAQEETTSLKRVAENIDIGGPAMIRAAAKSALLTNKVSVLTSPNQYDDFTREMDQNRGEISEKTREELAKEAFGLTYRYDLAIQNYLSKMVDVQ